MEAVALRAADVSDQVVSAIERAAGFLEATQRPDGRWLDFRGETFISSQWVTAYVGSLLARAGGAPGSLERARAWLLGHQHPGGGWGFSLANPPDADSIANVVHLLSQRRGPDEALARAIDLLLRYWVDAEGGFRTYLPIEGDRLHFPGSGWCDAHLSVTAMAAQALHAVDAERHRGVLEASARLVHARQAQAGFWEDYWWDGRTYATYHAARFLSLTGDEVSVARAGDWLMEVRLPGGGWGNGVTGAAAPFHTAFAVGTLLLDKRRRHDRAIDEGVAWLLRAQLADGSFAAVPTQRVTRPSARAPWEDPEGSLLRPLLTDHNRLFTTATVLSILADYRGTPATAGSCPMAAARGPIEIFSSALKGDTSALFARLRAEQPVSRVMFGGRPFWLITRYQDAVTALKDPRLSKSPENAAVQAAPRVADPSGEVLEVVTNLLHLDPPQHTRLRSIVYKSLTPLLIEGLRGPIQRLADELLDAGLARGEMDVMGEYGYPLSVGSLAELLGAPAEDRGRLNAWARAFVEEPRSPVVLSFAAYARRLIEARRALPARDLVSALVRVQDDGTALEEAELLSTMFLLLVAGYDTTASLIGNGVLLLLDHPEQRERLRREPALIKTAVEEILRYKGPAKLATSRFAREDMEVAGQVIRKGETVYIALGSADHDAEHVRDPEAFDLAREENKHLGFGLGIHYCLGAALARLEGQIAIGTLLRRAPGLRLKGERSALAWRENFFVGGPEELRVIFG